MLCFLYTYDFKVRVRVRLEVLSTELLNVEDGAILTLFRLVN